MPFEYRVSSLSCRRTIHEHRLLVCRRFTSSPSFQTGREACKVFLWCTFPRHGSFTRHIVVNGPSKLNFRLKSERGCRWRRAATYAATPLPFRWNFTFGLSLLPFLSFFFLLELSRTKLCKFPTRRFPRWPDYKKKENHPLFLIHVTRVIFIKEKNFIYRSKGGEMIRDYLLLLSWLCAVQGKIGKYPDGDACVSAPF